MKVKKIIALLLAAILTLGMATASFALPEDDFEIELYGTFYKRMDPPTITDYGSGALVRCNFYVPGEGTATVTAVIMQSTSASGSRWTTYDSDSDSTGTPYNGRIDILFSSLPSGYYYYASVTLHVVDAASGRTESVTKKTSTIYI